MNIQEHECTTCAAKDIIREDGSGLPYTCSYCIRAWEMAGWLSEHGQVEFQQWQIMLMSRFMRAKDVADRR